MPTCLISLTCTRKPSQIPAISLAILNTGWHKRFGNPTEYINMDSNKVMHFPGFGADSAKLLVERDVVGIGIDTLSLDYGGSSDFATHIRLCHPQDYSQGKQIPD